MSQRKISYPGVRRASASGSGGDSLCALAALGFQTVARDRYEDGAWILHKTENPEVDCPWYLAAKHGPARMEFPALGAAVRYLLTVCERVRTP